MNKSSPPPKFDSSRERIHAAALRLLSRHGFEGMSLRMVADEVGLHKSTLFHHYKSKAEIAHEVVETCVNRVVEKMASLDGEPESLEQLLAVSDALVDHFADSPDAARLLLSVLVAPEESELLTPPGARSPTLEFYRLIVVWLDRARAKGLIGDVSVRQAVFNLIGLSLLYPAAVLSEVDLVGSDPFGERARTKRKEMLRHALTGMLAPR